MDCTDYTETLGTLQTQDQKTSCVSTCPRGLMKPLWKMQGGPKHVISLQRTHHASGVDEAYTPP